MVSFGRKHCKYDMHIYVHASFLVISFKSFIDDKDYTAQSVCNNNLLFVCLYKSLRSTCFVLLYKLLLLCNVFVFYMKKQDFFLKKKSCVDFHFISLIHSYVYIHIALCYQELCLEDSCNNLVYTFCIAKISIIYISIDAKSK